MEQQGLQGPRIALLIDFDNVILGVDEPPGFDVELVVNALRSRGVVVLGRAYGDWYRHNRHRRKLMEQGIELVETPAFGPIIKNSADIRIALDAFEIGMTQSHISHFCLVSGDSDFLPLVKRLQLLGKTVIVIAGNKFTSELIRRNCNEYVSYENLLAESVGATEDATTLEGAYALLSRTVNTMNERGQDARSSAVKQMMLQLNPVFSERSFGCSQFKQFLNKACGAGIIRLGNRDSDSGEYHVRLIDDNGDSPEESSKNIAPENSLISDLETTPVRPRKSTSPPKPAPAAEPANDDDSINLAEEIANNASTVSPSRRGRLRFSGRTWRSSGTSTKTVETTETSATDEAAATAAPEEVESTPEATPEPTPEVNDVAGSKVTETAATGQKDTGSKKAGRKSSKTASAKTAKEPETPEVETVESKEKSDEATAAPEEEKPKKKAPARRRTSSRTSTKTRTTKTKKAESGAETTPVATEEAPPKETAAKPEPASEDAAAEKEAAEEKKPKKKTPVRRRTSSRTTKKKDDEKTAEATEPTEANSE